MSKTLAIIADGFTEGTVCAAPDFEKAKADAIEAANSISQTITVDEIEKAATAKRNLAELRIWIEERRKIIKAPYWEKGKEVDALAVKLVDGIDKAEKRIESMINARQKEILDEQERQRAELDRIAKEAEANRIAAEKEAARLEAEAEATRQREAKAREDAETARIALEAANSPEAKSAAQKAAQEAAAREQTAKEEAAKIAAAQQVAAEKEEELAMTPLPAAPLEIAQARSVHSKKVFDYEIIGSGNEYKEQVSLAEFAKAHPLLVKYSIRRADVLDRLNGPGFGDKAPPGLRIFEKIKSRI